MSTCTDRSCLVDKIWCDRNLNMDGRRKFICDSALTIYYIRRARWREHHPLPRLSQQTIETPPKYDDATSASFLADLNKLYPVSSR